MSAVTSRPQVQSVTSASLTAAALIGVGAIGAAIIETLRSTSQGRELARDMPLRALGSNASREVLPVGVLEPQLSAVEAALPRVGAGATSLDAQKVRVLQALSATPSFASPEACRSAVMALVGATSIAEVSVATKDLAQIVRSEQRRVMEQSLAVACRAAATDIGFRPVASSVSVDGTLRLLASDKDGRALVTEIRHDASGMPGVQTEVLGVGDGACHGLLDGFDQALSREGVRSAATKRRETGGVCQLTSSQELSRTAPGLRPASVARRARPATALVRRRDAPRS